MSRISQSFRHRLGNRIVAKHDLRIARRKAEDLIQAVAVNYMPAKLRAVVKAGLQDCLRTDACVQFGDVYTYVYAGTDAVAMSRDANLRRQVLRLVPKKARSDSWTLRRPIMQRLAAFDTYKQLTDAHPELAELISHLRYGTPEPDGDKLRRKLLRAGWELRAGKSA